MLSETIKMQKDKYCMFYASGASEGVTFIETESGMMAASGGDKGETGSYSLGVWSSRFLRRKHSGDLIHTG